MDAKGTKDMFNKYKFNMETDLQFTLTSLSTWCFCFNYLSKCGLLLRMEAETPATFTSHVNTQTSKPTEQKKLEMLNTVKCPPS